MSGAPTGVAVRLRGVSKAYGDQVVLDDLDLDIAAGELVALLGPSGTGKTTLLRLLAGFEQPDAGTVLVPRRRTVVYQEPRLVPAHRVLRNVLLGRRRTADNVRRARQVLAEVGLESKERDWPSTLSGGEAQRVALARALVNEPDLLLADEPFAALDALTRITMHGLVERLRVDHDPAIVLVTHDVDEAVRLADRVITLDHGRVALDERIDLAHPRDAADDAQRELKTRLLRTLGVRLPAPVPEGAS